MTKNGRSLPFLGADIEAVFEEHRCLPDEEQSEAEALRYLGVVSPIEGIEDCRKTLFLDAETAVMDFKP